MDAENPHKLTKGSVIQYGDDYGVIKWIGLLHGSGDTFFAGLEMVRDIYLFLSLLCVMLSVLKMCLQVLRFLYLEQ